MEFPHSANDGMMEWWNINDGMMELNDGMMEIKWWNDGVENDGMCEVNNKMMEFPHFLMECVKLRTKWWNSHIDDGMMEFGES